MWGERGGGGLYGGKDLFGAIRRVVDFISHEYNGESGFIDYLRGCAAYKKNVVFFSRFAVR